MSRLLFQNIRQLLQVEQRPRPLLRGKQMSSLPVLEEAYLLIEDGRIADFGSMENCPERADEEIDARGRLLLPCWCDSHTHLVFAGSREGEFTDRIRGLSYEEIASRGGGILNSAKLLRQTPEEDLFEQSWGRLKEIIAYGTGAVEIKSGYGLSLEGELKMLRVIRRLREAAPIPVKATFLGAHALPEAYRDKREAYLRLLIDDLLPRIAGEGLADYIDVFCERNFFNLKETEQLLEAGARYGLRPKIHTNQFNAIGGISAAVRHHAVSVDHLEVVADADIEALRGQDTIATLLPSAPFFINDPYPPARRLIEADIPVALATDYNPGSSPSGKMPFVLSLACIKLRMTPAEAINAATLNGAYAIELEKQLGGIARGKTANVILTKPVPSPAYLPYAFGSDWIEGVFLNGKRWS